MSEHLEERLEVRQGWRHFGVEPRYTKRTHLGKYLLGPHTVTIEYLLTGWRAHEPWKTREEQAECRPIPQYDPHQLFRVGESWESLTSEERKQRAEQHLREGSCACGFYVCPKAPFAADKLPDQYFGVWQNEFRVAAWCTYWGACSEHFTNDYCRPGRGIVRAQWVRIEHLVVPDELPVYMLQGLFLRYGVPTTTLSDWRRHEDRTSEGDVHSTQAGTHEAH